MLEGTLNKHDNIRNVYFTVLYFYSKEMREREPLLWDFLLNLVPFQQKTHLQESFCFFERIYPYIHMVDLSLRSRVIKLLIFLLNKMS